MRRFLSYWFVCLSFVIALQFMLFRPEGESFLPLLTCMTLPFFGLVFYVTRRLRVQPEMVRVTLTGGLLASLALTVLAAFLLLGTREGDANIGLGFFPLYALVVSTLTFWGTRYLFCRILPSRTGV